MRIEHAIGLALGLAISAACISHGIQAYRLESCTPWGKLQSLYGSGLDERCAALQTR